MTKGITFVLAGSLGAVGMVAAGCEEEMAPPPSRGDDQRIDRARDGREGDQIKDATNSPSDMKDPDRSRQAPKNTGTLN